MSRSRLDILIEKTNEYKNSFNSDNNYQGDESLLSSITTYYNALSAEDKSKFKKHILHKLGKISLSPEEQKIQRNITTNTVIGGVALPILVDVCLGGSNTLTKGISALTGAGLGFFASSDKEKFADSREKLRRAKKPYVSISENIGILSSWQSSMEKRIYIAAESVSPGDTDKQSGLRQRR